MILLKAEQRRGHANLKEKEEVCYFLIA